MNAVAIDIDSAYHQIPIFGVKLLNPAVVKNLGLTKISIHADLYQYNDNYPRASSETSFSTTSDSPSCHTPSVTVALKETVCETSSETKVENSIRP